MCLASVPRGAAVSRRHPAIGEQSTLHAQCVSRCAILDCHHVTEARSALVWIFRLLPKYLQVVAVAEWPS